MEFEAVRLALAAAVLVPAAVWDARSRSVPVWWLYAGWAASGALTIHDVASGGLGWWPAGAAVAGAAAGGLLVVLSKYVMLGAADGHAMAVSSLLLPWHEGVPLALCGMAAGCAAALVWACALNASYNVRDMVAGRAVQMGDFLVCHRKRRGERFAIGTERSGPVHADESGVIRDGAGDLFEPAQSEGGKVRPAVPVVSFVAAGVLGVSSYVMWP